MMNDYQINFLVKAIVSLKVKANTPEEAQEIAKQKLVDMNIFNTKLDVHDYNRQICGYDNDDMWREVSS